MEERQDLISKQAAIDALKKYEELESDNFTDTSPISMMTVATIANCIEEIVILPSAQPERKKGRWISQDFNKHNGMMSTTAYYYPKCSVCGHSANYTNFCPNCGAKMDEEGEADVEKSD